MLAAALRGFPYSKADDDTLLLYVMALDDMPFQEFRAALMKLLKTSKFFPSIAEIYEAAGSIRQTADKSSCPDAGQAWAEAWNLVKTCHIYKAWTYSTPEIEQAVKQFGKMELIGLKESDMNTARAQFMRIYNEVVKRKKEHEQNKEVLAKLGLSTKELDGIEFLDSKSSSQSDGYVYQQGGQSAGYVQDEEIPF